MNKIYLNKLLLLFVIVPFINVEGQDFSFPELKGYKTVSDYQVYKSEDLWNYIDGAADAYLALGFIDLRINEYVKGKQSIKAEVYRFASDTRAFGIYSLERSPDYKFINAGVQGYNEDGVVNFYKGNYYIKIMTHSSSKKMNESMIALAGLIAERIKGSNDFPSILKTFPSEGLLKNQETYIFEAVLGHEYLKGAFRASYEIDGDGFDIYIIDCQSLDEAAGFVSKLTNTPAGNSGDETDRYVFEDGYNGILYLVRKGSRVVVLSGLGRDKVQMAEHYLDLIAK